MLLRPDFYHGSMRSLLAQWLRVWLRQDPFLRRVLAPLVDPATGQAVQQADLQKMDRVKQSALRFTPDVEQALLAFIEGASMGERPEGAAKGAATAEDAIENTHPSVVLLRDRCRGVPSAFKVLHLARQWIITYLPHVLGKIDRVSFGLLQPEDLAKTAGGGASIPIARKYLAVPFVGKDQPSRASEFAQVDT